MIELKNIRKELGITQSEIARTLGVSRSIISMAESGFRSLPDYAFVKLGELKKSAEQFADHNKDENSYEKFQDELGIRILEMNALVLKRENLISTAENDLMMMRQKYSRIKESIRVMSDELKMYEGIVSYTAKISDKLKQAEAALVKTNPVQQRILFFRIKEIEALVNVAKTEIYELQKLKSKT